MASTLTTFAALTKTRYTPEKIRNLTEADRPLYAMISKETFYGESYTLPLIYGNGQGVAGTSLATAQGAATNLKNKKFIITPGDYYGSVSIGDKVIAASQDNTGAFLRNKIAEIDGLYAQMADSIATYQYSNGGNAIGQRASISTNTITLSEPSSSVNFEVGMTVVASSADGSGSSDALRTGSTTVTAVDRSAGTVTVASAAAITSFNDNDYLFRSGDFIGNTGAQIFTGLGGFLWGSTAAPPNLYSMVRTDDINRLAGCKLSTTDVSGLSMEERLQKLGAYMVGRFKTPGFDTGFLNPEDWQDLAVSLQSKGIRPLDDKDTQFGFQSITLIVGGKAVKVYPDRYCPKGTFFGLRMQDWVMLSMGGELIRPIEQDGVQMLRNSTTNDYEYRLVSYPGMGCRAPGYSGRAPLT